MNYERWDWSTVPWQCMGCGVSADKAVHEGKHGLEPGPYNTRQAYCSSACADRGKAKLQAERRAAERERRRQAWRCFVCGRAAADYPGRRLTCSGECARVRQADLQTERRWGYRAGAALSRTKAVG